MSASNQHGVGGKPAAGSDWLPSYAKLVVLAIFVLLFLGGLVTSWQAGMAVPDWPLSFGSLNPHGWWDNFPVRLEHGHRLTAMFVGVLAGVLCAWIWAPRISPLRAWHLRVLWDWIWENWRALVLAVLVSAILPPLAKLAGASPIAMMHLAIWPAAAVFVATLLLQARGRVLPYPPLLRWLTLAFYFCICIQATLGGFRVTTEAAGAIDTALILRILHGSFAQIFVLSLAVAVAAIASPAWSALRPLGPKSRSLRRLAWIVFAVLCVQLIFGATMRHMGAGLAIPKFPKVSDTAWLPAVHSAAVDTNFTHTRVGAALATILIITLSIRVLRHESGNRRLVRSARAMLALILIQIILGVLVIQIQTPPLQGDLVNFLTRSLPSSDVLSTLRGVVGVTKTVHMLNGALTLATSLLLALRLTRASSLVPVLESRPIGGSDLSEAMA